MANFLEKINVLFNEAKLELAELFAISLGVFLFILFFNPFGLNNPDQNNQLLVILGLGGITFFFMALFYVVLPDIFPKLIKKDIPSEEPQYIIGFIAFALNSVAFVFYLRYVGQITLTFYMVFKIVIVCLAPYTIYWIIQTRVVLKHQIILLTINVERMKSMLSGQIKNTFQEKTVIESENKSESLEVILSDILFLRSADNYIELIYLENGELRKKMLRNTLKNVEKHLSQYPGFIRCHRTILINTSYIERLFRSYTGVMIKIKGYDLEIPVSRQYLLKVKEITKT
jgi:DNA-binding LytR/AlgR family response regulator